MRNIILDNDGLFLEIHSDKPLNKTVLNQFPKFSIISNKEPFIYSIPPGPNASFVLNVIANKFNFSVNDEAKKIIDKFLPLAPVPQVFLYDSTHIGIEYPSIPFYQMIAEKLSAAPKSYTIGTIAFSRAYEVIRLVTSISSWLPSFQIKQEVKDLMMVPLNSFSGTLPSVLNEDVEKLITASNAYRVPVENFSKAGYTKLYDLILNRPRRYIDKTAVLDRKNWVKGEDVTFIGKITEKKVIRNQHSYFELDVAGSLVKCTFWRRSWMDAKFSYGEDVLIIGRWDGRQVNGASMDSLLEANVLPIIPIYSQSAKLGISSKLIMNCIYEIFERYSVVSKTLVSYISDKNLSMSLPNAVKELHFPTSSNSYKDALDVLAFYELVYMQLLILNRKMTEVKAKGLAKPHVKGGLFDSALKSLPFELTDGQKQALNKINKKLSTDTAEEVLISADVGAGKGLPENELVSTPTGWRKMKDLKVGDFVTGANGKPTKVVGVYPQGYQEMAKIEFSDNTEIETDLQHLWEVEMSDTFDNKYKTGKRPSYIISTGDMLTKSTSKIKRLKKDKNGKIIHDDKIEMNTYYKKNSHRNKWRIPIMSSPIEYSNSSSLPLDPYLFGYWLGDGSKNNLDFALGNHDLESFLTQCESLWDGYTVVTPDPRSNAVSVRLKKEGVFTSHILKNIGVFCDKHIPQSYLLSSVEDRISLLQGLIDSDGSIDPSNSISFSNTNKRIISGIIELVQSLGGIAWKNTEKYKTYPDKNGEKVKTTTPSWIVTIHLPTGIAPSRLIRKNENYKSLKGNTKRSHKLIRTITNVTKLKEKQKTICIKVDAEDELFVTKSFIVTHNTLVAQLTCLQAVDNGYQAVLAGPTEVLAKQLYETFVKLINGIPQEKRPKITYLSGETKAREKKQIYKSIEYGEIDLIVGTHSVFSDKVPYKNLGVVLVDEQQKFGAAQRTSLQDMGVDGAKPDIITQTATPIPRSTAQVFYGDIDLVTINQKPKGRLPIITEWIVEDSNELLTKKNHSIWKDIVDEANENHKTFIVVPMVYENDKLNVASVENTVKELKKITPSLNVEYIHGQMKKKEQGERMDNFRSSNADVLVASTVIEVGVDVPEATRVIILSADRIGASSLHQIRGRVGRNSLQSKCYLVSDNTKESTSNRLNSLVNSNDGFEIATVDLHTRGEGDLFGSKQSGETNFNFVNLVDHTKMVEEAQQIAKEIYNSPRRYEALEDAKSILEQDKE